MKKILQTKSMKKILLLLSLLLTTAITMAETGLTVQPLTGPEQQYAISKIGRIQLANNITYLYDKTGTELGHTPIANINKIVFEEIPDTSSGTDDLQNTTNIRIFPNPAQEALIIKGVQIGEILRIFNLNGQLLSSHAATSDETSIPTNKLQQGTYLLQIGAEVVKFIKQ